VEEGLMKNLLIRHPWIALLGWFPPVWLAGLVRLWGNDDYDVVVADLFDLAVTVSAVPWWPLNLYGRLRRDAKRRRA
jgi:hypothetical protein